MSELKRKKKVIIIYELKVYDTWIGSITLVCLLLSVCGCLVSGLDAFQMVDLVTPTTRAEDVMKTQITVMTVLLLSV